jgi:hypothetical protein
LLDQLKCTTQYYSIIFRPTNHHVMTVRQFWISKIIVKCRDNAITHVLKFPVQALSHIIRRDRYFPLFSLVTTIDNLFRYLKSHCLLHLLNRSTIYFSHEEKRLFLMYFRTFNSNIFPELLYHLQISRYIRVCDGISLHMWVAGSLYVVVWTWFNKQSRFIHV